MTKKSRPPLAGLSTDDDLDRIRAYGLSRGFLPTDTTPAPPQPPAPVPDSVSGRVGGEDVPSRATAAPPLVRPAPTKPWQAMFPDYLSEALRQAAAREGTAQKVIVMRALRMAGFQVDDIDLQDLRRR